MFEINPTNDPITGFHTSDTMLMYTTTQGRGCFEFMSNSILEYYMERLAIMRGDGGSANIESMLVNRIFLIEGMNDKQTIANFSFNGM